MSFLERLGSFKQKTTHTESIEQSGVLPKSDGYGVDFRFILGSTPDGTILKKAFYDAKNIFARGELVIVTITNLNQEIVTVYGSVMGTQKKDGYEILTAHPYQLALGEAGYIHTLGVSKIGKIPSSFAEDCYKLELEARK